MKPADPKTKVYHDLWGFIFSAIPKSKNLEITKILQILDNTKVGVSSLKKILENKTQKLFKQHPFTMIHSHY